MIGRAASLRSRASHVGGSSVPAWSHTFVLDARLITKLLARVTFARACPILMLLLAPLPQAFNDPWVQQWAFGLLALQAVLMVVLSIIPSPMSEDVGVAAHQLTIAVPFAYAAYHGARLWFFDEAFAAMGTSAHGRLYAASEDCFSLTRFMFGMQVCNARWMGMHGWSAGSSHGYPFRGLSWHFCAGSEI